MKQIIWPGRRFTVSRSRRKPLRQAYIPKRRGFTSSAKNVSPLPSIVPVPVSATSSHSMARIRCLAFQPSFAQPLFCGYASSAL